MQITAFGVTFPVVWSLLAFSSGMVAILIIKSLLRWGDIIGVVLTTLFMAIPLLIIILAWRFLAFEPPIIDSVANIFVYIGVIIGYGTDTVARVMAAWDEMRRVE